MNEKQQKIYQQGYHKNKQATLGWLSATIGYLAITGFIFMHHKGAATLTAIATYGCLQELHKSIKRMNFDAYRLKNARTGV